MQKTILVEKLEQKMQELLMQEQNKPGFPQKLSSFGQSDPQMNFLMFVATVMEPVVKDAMEGQKLYKLVTHINVHKIMDEITSQEVIGFPLEKIKELKSSVPEIFLETGEVFFTQDGGIIGKFSYDDDFSKSFWQPLIKAIENPDSEAGQILNHVSRELMGQKYQFQRLEEAMMSMPVAQSVQVMDENGQVLVKGLGELKEFMKDPAGSIHRFELKNKINNMSNLAHTSESHFKP